MKIALILAFLSIAGCANPFEFVDHGCQIDPQSCR